jgi:hypothetical protein
MKNLLLAAIVLASVIIGACGTGEKNDEDRYRIADAFLIEATSLIKTVDSMYRYEDPKYWELDNFSEKIRRIRVNLGLAESEIKDMASGAKKSELMERYVSLQNVSNDIESLPAPEAATVDPESVPRRAPSVDLN